MPTRIGVSRRGIALMVALGLSALLSTKASAQSYIFGRADFPISNTPNAILTADFNGDGRLDLAVVSQTQICQIACEGSVAILLGQPNGSFGPETDFPVGNGAIVAISGDFNRDGKLDLAVLNLGDSTISILLGNGDGTFQPQVPYATGGEFGGIAVQHALAAADFNGDGKVDLAVVNTGASTISILLGNGDGTFAPHFDYPAPDAASLATGDFNGDGKIDIAFTGFFNNGTTLSILPGNGDGTFQNPVTFDIGIIANGLAAADLNHDGKLDLVASSGIGIVVLLGNGNGTFQPPVAYGAQEGSSVFVIADLNGDGKPDVLVGGNGVGVLLGNGDGTLQPDVHYEFGLGLVGTTGLTVGDVNGDGLQDVAVADFELPGVRVLLGKGAGTLPAPASYSMPAASQGAASVATGDFNNDGKQDLAVTAGLEVGAFLGNGDGTFQPAQSFSAGRQASVVAVGDFNQDGKLDLAVVESLDNQVAIFLGKGDGTFQAGQIFATGIEPVAIGVADFNGDGKLDLAVANANYQANSNATTGTVSILLGNGDGTFQSHVDYPVAGTFPLSLALADFNKDAKLDLAVGSLSLDGSSAVFSLLLGKGDGTFQTPVNTVVPTPSAATPSAFLVAGDFNNDGNPDVALAHGSTLSVLLGNGSGAFGPPIDTQFSFQTGLTLTATDFNGDGKLDVVATVNFGNQLIFLGNGDGTFRGPEQTSITAGGLNPIIAADLNGDGGTDLASIGPGDGAVSVLLNVPTLALYPTQINFPGRGVGTTSPQVTLQVINAGSMNINISNIAVGGSFAHTTTCGSSLTVGTACDVNLTFSPAGTGAVAGSVTFTDTAPGSPQVIGISGTGVNGPFASLSPLTVDFGGQPLGTTSAALTVTLANTGNASLAITGISATGDFTAANTCNGSVAAGSSCPISVTFKPSMAGFRGGNLTITDNSGNGTQVVALVGTGTVPAVTLSPPSLSFAYQLVGTTSSPLGVALTNSGAAPLNITKIATSGDFTVASGTNCSTTGALAAGASCTIEVSFAPTASGTRTGTLSVTDNAPGSPQTASLTGLGAAPIVQVLPVSFTFPGTLVGTTSAPLSVTVNNEGGSPASAPLTITKLTTTGDFAISATGTDCLTNNAYPPSVFCLVAVTFTPTAAGTRTGSLIITDNAPDSPQTVALTGGGADFSLAVPSGSSASATVTAGQTAFYKLSILPTGGFNSTVSLACSGAPAQAVCSVPSSVAVGGGSSLVTVSVATAASSLVAPRPPAEWTPWPSQLEEDQRWYPLLGLWLAGLALLAVLAGLSLAGGDRRRWPVMTRVALGRAGLGRLALGFVLLLTLVWASCGGGSSNSGTVRNPGTPAGTYTLTVTGTVTAGSTTLKQTINLTLTVQ